MSTALLDRPAEVKAGEVVTGRVVSTGPREIRVILATDRPQRDGLALDMDGVQFRRGIRELPLIVAHDLKSVPIGKVRDIRVEQRSGFKCLTGALVFGASRRAKEIEHDIRLGIITDVSIGFDIPDKSARDWRTGRVRTWLCTEASLVPVGLDPEAVVYQRSHHRPEKEVTVPYPSARTREYYIRPYGADRDTGRRSRHPLTGQERAALRSLLDGGRLYEQTLVEGYERSVLRRWDETGREHAVAPWFPLTQSATGYRSTPPPAPYARSADRSRIHFVPGQRLPDDTW